MYDMNDMNGKEGTNGLHQSWAKRIKKSRENTLLGKYKDSIATQTIILSEIKMVISNANKADKAGWEWLYNELNEEMEMSMELEDILKAFTQKWPSAETQVKKEIDWQVFTPESRNEEKKQAVSNVEDDPDVWKPPTPDAKRRPQVGGGLPNWADNGNARYVT